jgi:trehalose 6-phosphate synthase
MDRTPASRADVCVVSSRRDGLNLVAAEYAAAQIETDGVLVLSDQSGIHDLLGESAVSISPYDPGQIADQFETALTMDQPERQSRMQTMRQSIAANDLERWIQKHTAVASETATERERSSPST